MLLFLYIIFHIWSMIIIRIIYIKGQQDYKSCKPTDYAEYYIKTTGCDYPSLGLQYSFAPIILLIITIITLVVFLSNSLFKFIFKDPQ